MEEKPYLQINRYIRIGVTILSVALILYILWYFKTIAIYILLGVVFSLLARPIYVLLEKVKIGRFRIPDPVSAIISLLCIWLVAFVFLASIIPLIINEGAKLSKIDPETVLKELEQPINQSIAYMEKYGILHFVDTVDAHQQHTVLRETIYVEIIRDSSKNDSVQYIPIDTIKKPVEASQAFVNGDTLTPSGIAHREELENMIIMQFNKFFNFTKVSTFFESIFSVFTNFIIAVFASTFMAFFFLRDKNLFFNMVLAMVPEKYESHTITILQESRKMLSRYFIGLAFELLLVMIATTLGLLIIGFPFTMALLIGFLCGFFNIIPYVGPVIGATFGIILGLTNNLDLDFATQIVPMLGKMVIVFAVVQFLDNNIFQTLIFSSSVNAHPLEIFIVIIIAGNIAGITGMIFAVPGYTFLRIIARQFFTNFKLVRSLTKNM
jgi:predicted PurR-regulated permease PerM